jgi:ketosteroid isomerase-like protein
MSTPREVLRQLMDGMADKKWDQLPDLFAEDVVIEHPLSTGPMARIEGRAKVREHFARMAGFDGVLHVDDLVVHETTDPEVVISEVTFRGTFGGTEATMAGIRVMRVRDGLIVSSRDYGNAMG